MPHTAMTSRATKDRSRKRVCKMTVAAPVAGAEAPGQHSGRNEAKEVNGSGAGVNSTRVRLIRKLIVVEVEY
jgi:hypothetical protein